MKRIAKWTTMLLSLALVMNCLTFYSVGDVILPVGEVTASEMEFEIFDEPVVREEIVEWREEGVRHYYLGNGMYQAVVSAEVADENIDSPAAATPNSSAIKDTYISSLRTNVSYGSNSTMLVSDTQIAFIGFQLPILQDNAYIESARLYFNYYFSSETAANMTIGAYPVMFAWEEDELNWDIANAHTNLGIGTASLGYCGLGVTTNPRQANVAVSDIVKSWYETLGATNYGIALKKYSSAASTVTLLSKESGNATAPYIVIDYTLKNLPIENGQYYIQNAAIKNKYENTGGFNEWCALVQTKNNANSDYGILTSMFCEMSEVTGYANQIWEVQYLHNGYYVIKNKEDNTAITVPVGKELDSNITLIRAEFSGNVRQQWKITKLSSGTIKIKSRSSESSSLDLVMATKYADTIRLKDIEQREYNGGDNLYSDEWYFHLVGNQGYFLGVNDLTHDHHSLFAKSMYVFQNNGYNNFLVNRGNTFTKSEILENMENCSVFINRSHGDINEEGIPFVYLLDNMNQIDNTVYQLRSTDIYDFDTQTPNIDLSGCEIMLFVSCYSASMDEQSVHTAAYLAGAQCSIGFVYSINCEDANKWTSAFLNAYNKGFSAFECRTQANNQNGYELLTIKENKILFREGSGT